MRLYQCLGMGLRREKSKAPRWADRESGESDGSNEVGCAVLEEKARWSSEMLGLR